MGGELVRVRKLLRAGAGLVAASLVLLGGPARAASDYSDSAYRDHDLDNVSRSTARQTGEFTSPEYGSAFAFTAAESWLQAQGNQVGDARSGRVHGGLGQLLPGGAVGDPQHYYDLTPIRVQFLSRTGAKLSGRIWGADGKPKPGIVITTGSIQGTEHMYWWAARSLVAAGYEVFTWDVQGQGESESAGHRFGDPTPTADGVPSQQAANFTEGTIDALRFFLSTPDHPYLPKPRTVAEVDAAKAAAAANGEHLDWVNPGYAALDHTRLGIAGHSLGASAVSEVQQCSDAGSVWATVPVCQGTSFPIRAVVAWDRLTADGGIVPVVPGMDQEADGYFMNPQPAPQSPDPQAHLAAERAWEKAGLDTYAVTVRGGCHTEWTQIPWISAGTSYGTKLADFYTRAWFDRYVMGDRQATQRLLSGPKAEAPGTPDPADVAWNAHHFSTRYLGAFSLGRTRVTDLRVYAGLSKVGDWAGSNADREGRVLP